MCVSCSLDMSACICCRKQLLVWSYPTIIIILLAFSNRTKHAERCFLCPAHKDPSTPLTVFTPKKFVKYPYSPLI